MMPQAKMPTGAFFGAALVGALKPPSLHLNFLFAPMALKHKA